MKKKLLELQYLEEKKLKTKMMNIENIGDYFRLYYFFNDLSVIFFVMDICVIIMAVISEFALLENYKFLNLIFIFGLSSLAFLLSSVFYEYKIRDEYNKCSLKEAKQKC